jgi:hypothetical protein
VTDVSESGRPQNDNIDDPDSAPIDPGSDGHGNNIPVWWSIDGLPMISHLNLTSWLESNINLPADSELTSISNNDALLETYDFIIDAPDTWILDFETFENNQNTVEYTEVKIINKNIGDVINDDYWDEIIHDPFIYSE